MRKYTLLTLVLACLLAPSGQAQSFLNHGSGMFAGDKNYAYVSPDVIEGEWPLTIEDAVLVCFRRHGSAGGIFLWWEGEAFFPVNGIAKGWEDIPNYRPLGQIWKPRPEYQAEFDADPTADIPRLSISPILGRGLALCPYAPDIGA